MTVVVVGSLNVDETLPVSAWPRPGETMLLAGPVVTGLGGKGANQAVAAALAGAEVALVGAVGADAGGEAVLDELRTRGVGVGDIRRIDGTATGRATILVHTDGENLILVDPGANARLRPSDVDAVRELIADADVVLVQGEVAASVIEATAKTCRAVGTRFVLNLAPPIDVSSDALATADPLIVNEPEARHLEIDPAAPDTDRVRSVVVTRGASGVTAIAAEGRIDIAAHRVETVDTTGAGDAFAGTLCAALAAGADLGTACRAANRAAAYAVTRPGASGSYGTPAQIAALLADD
jgi:ribokinase